MCGTSSAVGRWCQLNMVYQRDRSGDEPEPIVAIGLLTQGDLNLLGSGFRRAFRVDDTPCFDELLEACLFP